MVLINHSLGIKPGQIGAWKADFTDTVHSSSPMRNNNKTWKVLIWSKSNLQG